MVKAILDSQFKIIQPSGYISAANAVEFQNKLTEALKAQQPSTVLVDMELVDFLDSAGLMALVSALNLAQSRKRRFCLCAIHPSIKMIFELTQLDGAFEIFESRDAFAAAFNHS